MIPAEFDYVRPASLDEVLAALREGGEDAKLIAGGHSLLPLMKLRLAAPALLVDLGGVPGLSGIERANGGWRIGAMTTHSAMERQTDLGLASIDGFTLDHSLVIDNTPPHVEVQSPSRAAPRATIAFAVRDEQSPVQRVEYSLDASRWRVVYPKDGIPDSRREEFEVALEEGEVGRSVIIRATDAMHNVATAVAEVKK